MLADFVRLVHILFVMFVILIPFTNNEFLLTIHFIIVPFMMLHWLTNQSVCAFTELEKILRGTTEDSETIIGQIVGPIYKFQSPGQENMFVWFITISLWLISLYKLKQSGFKLFSHLLRKDPHPPPQSAAESSEPAPAPHTPPGQHPADPESGTAHSPREPDHP
mgnify:CR=1 FL=1